MSGHPLMKSIEEKDVACGETPSLRPRQQIINNYVTLLAPFSSKCQKCCCLSNYKKINHKIKFIINSIITLPQSTTKNIYFMIRTRGGMKQWR